MSRFIFVILFLSVCNRTLSQPTFKCGWNTYNTGIVIHEYTYSYTPADSIRLYLTDSSQVFVSKDSLVTMTTNYPVHDKSICKTVMYMNAKKLLLKKEEYRDENLQVVNEWRYDDKNRKIYHLEDNKLNGNAFKHSYDYASDKKNGETIVTESSYFNGRIEFYTKAYYDRKNVKLKEVRYNDNNKDIVHVETYTYGENGKIKERSVYFPEWKVTRKFEEKEGNEIPKCYRTLPVGTAEKISINTRIAFMKKQISKNLMLLTDKECHDFEYKFTNYTTCDIVVATTNVNNARKVIFRFKEKT